MKDNFCAYIDKGMRLHFSTVNGDLHVMRKPCCQLQNDLTPEQLKTQIPAESPETIFKHPSNQWYKDYFKNNNDLPPQCVRCQNLEILTGSSPRTDYNKRHNKGEFDGYDINRLDVVLGNTCNLACPFCSSGSSSLIDKLSGQLDVAPYNWQPLYSHKQPQSEKLAKYIAEILSTYKVHTIKVIGGEPFLKENWDAIGEVLDNKHAKDCSFEITTNGTIMNKKILNNLNNLKAARMLISVDSIDKNYDFIRWPHSWKKMEKNLKFLKENCPSNTYVKISPLVNIFSLEYLVKLEKFLIQLGFDYDFNTMIKPEHHPLNASNAPQEIIETVREQIQSEKLRNSLVSDPKVPKDMVKEQTLIFLKQRNMEAEDVLGPMTREWLEL